MHKFLEFIFEKKNSTCFGQFLCLSSGVLSWSCWSQAVSKTVWHIPLLCVQWKTADDGQRNCAKHVDFYCENKSEKLVHLIGFVIRRTANTRNSSQYEELSHVRSLWWPSGGAVSWRSGTLRDRERKTPIYEHFTKTCGRKTLSPIVCYINGTMFLQKRH